MSAFVNIFNSIVKGAVFFIKEIIPKLNPIKRLIKLKDNQIYFLCVFFILFVLSAFRDGLGTDYFQYAQAYSNPQSFDKFSFLFSYIFIDSLRLISRDYILFFIVAAFITNYFFIKEIFRNSSIIGVSLLIYIFFFYLSSFNLVRQFIAISLFFYFGINYIQNNKNKHYILLLLLIAQIHFSAYILFVFLFFKDKKRPLYFYILLWVISVLFVVFKDFQFAIIGYIIKSLSFLSFISDKFTSYSTSYLVFLTLGKTNLQFLIRNLLLILFFLSFNKLHEKKTILYLNLFFFGIVIGNFLNIFNQIGPRMSYFGDIALIFLVPDYIKLYKKKWRMFITALFLVFFISYGTYRFYIKNESEALPKKWRYTQIIK